MRPLLANFKEGARGFCTRIRSYIKWLLDVGSDQGLDFNPDHAKSIIKAIREANPDLEGFIAVHFVASFSSYTEGENMRYVIEIKGKSYTFKHYIQFKNYLKNEWMVSI